MVCFRFIKIKGRHLGQVHFTMRKQEICISTVSEIGLGMCVYGGAGGRWTIQVLER